MRYGVLFILLAIMCWSGKTQITMNTAGDMAMLDDDRSDNTYTRTLADPAQHKYFANLAEGYIQRQDYLKASQEFEKFIDEEGVKPEYYLRYGEVLKSLRLYAKAKFYFNKYAAFYPVDGRHMVESCDLARLEMKGQEFYTVELVPFSSFSSDFAPSLYKKDLIFNSFRPSSASERSVEDVVLSSGTVYVSGNKGTKPMTTFNVESGMPQNASHVRFSQNGNWVAFHISSFEDGYRLYDEREGSLVLYVGKSADRDDWSMVRPFTYNGNGYATGYPALSADGSVLYFASTMPGGYGGWDLYVSFRNGQGWTKPQNLGPVINTRGNEIAPFYSDQKLYFSSDWHTGLGGFDIFKATSTDGYWTNVRSMGYPLNSPKDDLDFCIDREGISGYISSNRVGGPGQYDIYRFIPEYEEVTIIVKDQQGMQPVADVEIHYQDNGIPTVRTDAHGKAILHHPEDGTGEVTIVHDDYSELTMSLRANKGQKSSNYEVLIDRTVQKQSIVEATAPKKTTGRAMPADMAPKKAYVAKPAKKEVDDNIPAPVIKTSNVVEEMAASKPATTTAIRTMYAVQVAAVGIQSDLASYQHLDKYGEVDGHVVNGLRKVRVGYFATRDEASKSLKLVKAAGYDDAFIVATDKEVIVATTKPKAYERIETTVTQPALSKPAPTIQTQDAYFVRLGTYSRPEFFDEATVADLGTVVREQKGDLTIMLLSGYSSFNDAALARNSAAQRGFVGCYVAHERNGEFVKAKF